MDVATVSPGQKENQYRLRPCVSCGADEKRAVVAVKSDPAAETADFETLRKRWCGFYNKKLFFSYYRCQHCGMLYAPRYFTEEQLNVLYGDMPPNMDVVGQAALERTQAGYFDELRKVSALKGGFLEIGPDVGMFAQCCLRYGHFTKYWMFEPNVSAHSPLKERLRSVDLHISTELLDLSPVPDGSIDAVAMIHVLDHIAEPVQFLRQLRRKLAPNAVVLTVTHDERSLLAGMMGARWPAYSLQHPHLFNPASMRSLLREADLAVHKVKPSVNRYPVAYLLEHIALGIGITLTLPRVPLELPVRLGNFVTIAVPSN